MDLTREDLHRLVWAHPAKAVADALGISSSLLSRVCKRFEIEAPGRGYWRRRETGRPLPVAKPLGGVHDEVVRRNAPDDLVQMVEARKKLRTFNADVPHAASVRLVANLGSQIGRRTASESQVRFVCTSSSEKRRTTDADGAMQPQADSRPTAANLRQLAERWHEQSRVMTFIEALREAARKSSPGHAAVIHLWLKAALQTSGVSCPLTEIQEYCRRVANAESHPPWFEE